MKMNASENDKILTFGEAVSGKEELKFRATTSAAINFCMITISGVKEPLYFYLFSFFFFILVINFFSPDNDLRVDIDRGSGLMKVADRVRYHKPLVHRVIYSDDIDSFTHGSFQYGKHGKTGYTIQVVLSDGDLQRVCKCYGEDSMQKVFAELQSIYPDKEFEA